MRSCKARTVCQKLQAPALSLRTPLRTRGSTAGTHPQSRPCRDAWQGQAGGTWNGLPPKCRRVAPPIAHTSRALCDPWLPCFSAEVPRPAKTARPLQIFCLTQAHPWRQVDCGGRQQPAAAAALASAGQAALAARLAFPEESNLNNNFWQRLTSADPCSHDIAQSRRWSHVSNP